MRTTLFQWFTLCVLAVAGVMPAPALSATSQVHSIRIESPIGVAVAEFVDNGIKAANRADAACVLIELDTPGGLGVSMRTIVQAILNSRIPVIVYVAPSGARAASAGVMITIAADVAAMAPGTNIGAAHPVSAGGKEINKTMDEKVTNDMVAYVKSIAEERGRNAAWAEKAVRESISATETEALKEKVIDLIARDRDALLKALDGRDIKGKGTLNLKEVEIVEVKENLRTKVLKIISDPNIAYILLMIGLAGLYFELSHPGAIVPGVIGGIAIILAFFAMQTLPVNYAGILLIVLALVFFIMEMKITSYGLLSVAGIIALSLGSLMLFKDAGPAIRLSWGVLVPTLVMVSGFFVMAAGLVFRAHTRKPMTGVRGLIGETGTVKAALSPAGKVLVHGELWQAKADREVAAGEKVRVTAVNGLVLKVEHFTEE